MLRQPVRSLQRWREVQAILIRYGFDILFDQNEIREIRLFLRDKFKVKIGDPEKMAFAVRFRIILEELGPTYIKLGQILSSRTDLLPEDWIVELSKLQDDVPAFPYSDVEEIIRAEFGRPINEVFLEFDEKPMAAASLGQVHRAVLPNLNEVVVKVRRPNIRKQIKSDMDILREIAKLAENRLAAAKRYGVISIIDEFAQSLHRELDFVNEATNAERLRKNMMDMGLVHVPSIYWDYVTDKILVMEYVHGMKVTDTQSIIAENVDTKSLASVLIRSIFKQLLVDGFYHADPHPGNLIIEKNDHLLTYIDLGMMGFLLSDQQYYFRELVQAILKRDSDEVTRLLLKIGIVQDDVKQSQLKRDVDWIINRYLDAPLERISFAGLLSEILQTVFKHGIRLPSELSLALKTLIQAEGVARQLDPKFVLFDILSTVSRQMFVQQLNPQEWAEKFEDVMKETLRVGSGIPRSTSSILHKIDSGDFELVLDIPDIGENINHLNKIANRMTAGLIFAGMVIGSALVMGISPETTWKFVPIIGILGFVISMLLGFIVVWGVFMDSFRKRRRKGRSKSRYGSYK